MNRLFYLIVVALLAISCESDNCPAPDHEANEIECTFTVGIPEIKTRAADPSGSGAKAGTLHWRFFDENNEPLDFRTVSNSSGVNSEGVHQWTISQKLVEGRDYYLYLWAGSSSHNSNQASSFGKLYFVGFNSVNNSTTVSVNKGVCYANNDEYDVFCNVVKITAGVNPGVITLKRPTAQLNIATRDVDAAAAAGAPVVSSWIKCKMVTTFDFVGPHTVTDNFTFKYAPIPTHTVTLNDGTGDKEYRVISMNYILMGDAEKQTQDIVFSYSENADGSNPVELTFTSVPIQRNHRTYIVGDLLTVDGSYTLTVLPMMDPASDEIVTVSAQ